MVLLNTRALFRATSLPSLAWLFLIPHNIKVSSAKNEARTKAYDLTKATSSTHPCVNLCSGFVFSLCHLGCGVSHLGQLGRSARKSHGAHHSSLNVGSSP